MGHGILNMRQVRSGPVPEAEEGRGREGAAFGGGGGGWVGGRQGCDCRQRAATQSQPHTQADPLALRSCLFPTGTKEPDCPWSPAVTPTARHPSPLWPHLVIGDARQAL